MNYEKEKLNIEEIRKSIKHPHFQYALYDSKLKKVIYKRKKWYQWFSGKRIVAIKIHKIQVHGLGDYKK